MNKEVIALANDVQNAAVPLTQAATVLEMTIENFGLDNAALTENQAFDLVHRFSMLSDALCLVKSVLYDTAEEIERITENAGKETNVA